MRPLKRELSCAALTQMGEGLPDSCADAFGSSNVSEQSCLYYLYLLLALK